MNSQVTGKKLGEPGGNRTLDPRIKSPSATVHWVTLGTAVPREWLTAVPKRP